MTLVCLVFPSLLLQLLGPSGLNWSKCRARDSQDGGAGHVIEGGHEATRGNGQDESLSAAGGRGHAAAMQRAQRGMETKLPAARGMLK